MALIIELAPETQAILERKARVSGREIEAYAAKVLESAAGGDSVHAPGRREFSKPKTLSEVCAMVSGLTDDLDFRRDPSPDRPIDF